MAVFRVNGAWGAIAKSNFSGLRYREPVYRSVRELVMSYFDGYVNFRGERTLRAYSRPVDLARFDSREWMTSTRDVWWIAEHLVDVTHVRLLTPAMERRLRSVDRRALTAALVGHQPAAGGASGPLSIRGGACVDRAI